MPSPPLPTFQLRIREGSPLHDGCTAQMAADVLLGFIAAFNKGDFEAAVEFFPATAAGSYMEPPQAGQFGWFAVTGEAYGINPGFGALKRAELLPYLVERHALNERWHLLQLEVAGSWTGGFGFVFDLLREADDIPTHVAWAKGSGDCVGGTISVWNLGDREGLTDFLNPVPLTVCPAYRPQCMRNPWDAHGARLFGPRAWSPSVQIRVREDRPLVGGCSASRVADVLSGFIDAFNRGDVGAAVAYFPVEPSDRGKPPVPGKYGWFGVRGALGGFNPDFGAPTRADLLPYLEQRYAHDEQLQLLELEVAGGRHGGVDVTFDLHRQADDIPTHTAGGTGLVDCESGTIAVWHLRDRELMPPFEHPSTACPVHMPRCE